MYIVACSRWHQGKAIHAFFRFPPHENLEARMLKSRSCSDVKRKAAAERLLENKCYISDKCFHTVWKECWLAKQEAQDVVLTCSSSLRATFDRFDVPDPNFTNAGEDEQVMVSIYSLRFLDDEGKMPLIVSRLQYISNPFSVICSNKRFRRQWKRLLK
ncbi:hypothetical protein FGB62_57g012 [Gracilaria domingensis]|nr:hypothetical protein FGB62_57g012 [Gracilaria domingensis]